jgi:hypothetical protein
MASAAPAKPPETLLSRSRFVSEKTHGGPEQQPRPGERTAIFVFGVASVVVLLALAVTVPALRPFQNDVFKVVLALAAAGIAALVPGFIQVQYRDAIRAGGALAIFVIVYFYSPTPPANPPDSSSPEPIASNRGRVQPASLPTAGAFRPMAGAFDQGRWSECNDKCLFVAGELQIYTHGGSVLTAAKDTSIRQDFTYSLRMEVVSGPTQLGFGLVFGMQDVGNYFLFSKRNAGDYRLAQWRDGQEHVIRPWTSSGYITDIRRPQRLKVQTEGAFVTLLADDQTLERVPVDREPAGSVGLFVDSPGLTVNFSDVSFGPRR